MITKKYIVALERKASKNKLYILGHTEIEMSVIMERKRAYKNVSGFGKIVNTELFLYSVSIVG